jgi:hypothetical protein
MRSLALLAAVSSLAGCSAVGKMMAPSNVRNWDADQAVLPYAEFRSDQVVVHNVRNCRHLDADSYVLQYDDRAYNLSDLRAVDFIIFPFAGMPRLAHTMLSFEFAPPRAAPPGAAPQRLVCSIEIRKEVGETYAAWKGGARQYELMYVLADERDAVEVRVVHRGEDGYLYRTTATPEQARLLLVDVLARANELASRPEFYNTLTNNCTTNLVRHVNRIHANRLQYDYRVLLPGYSDKLAFDEGLLATSVAFDEAKAAAYINPRAVAAAGRPDFSEVIRR